MKVNVSLVVGVLLIAAVFSAGQTQQPKGIRSNDFETRCGWFNNPTPANAWLWDSEGEWIIGVQGGFQSDGEWPNFKPRQWVRQNGYYGYGCACLSVRVDKQTHQIVRIKSSRARSLTQCRRDPVLKKWGRL